MEAQGLKLKTEPSSTELNKQLPVAGPYRSRSKADVSSMGRWNCGGKRLSTPPKPHPCGDSAGTTGPTGMSDSTSRIPRDLLNHPSEIRRIGTDIGRRRSLRCP
ncbi:hypothetical protein HPP92_006387 [Vanilla planifolia]|uniref:Uncharacterized protein n=1 Tax=Vanilla planifolia TaxID=51239 RepID=A0A835RIB3_VANPL|nr:hypothetical protein HPP92_006656 [Vanilla planifolia]KAG0489524.1 hypothetical protein HPP92_006387 [Vanilla planifolia]